MFLRTTDEERDRFDVRGVREHVGHAGGGETNYIMATIRLFLDLLNLFLSLLNLLMFFSGQRD